MKKPKNIRSQNVGVNWERTLFEYDGDRVNLEKVFMEAWDKENSNKGYRRHPIAQQLMLAFSDQALETHYAGRDDTRRDDLFYPIYNGKDEVCVYQLSTREYQIIATIIQWLGTNIGFSFVQECLQKAGYSVVRTDSFPRLQSPFTRFEIIKTKGREDKYHDHEEEDK